MANDQKERERKKMAGISVKIRITIFHIAGVSQKTYPHSWWLCSYSFNIVCVSSVSIVSFFCSWLIMHNAVPPMAGANGLAGADGGLASQEVTVSHLGH